MTNITFAVETDDALDPQIAGRFAARYGADPHRQIVRQAQALWNPVLDTLLNHRSVRRFLARPLPEGALELLVAAAQSAPSSSNLQNWSLVAVESPEGKAKLATLCGGQKHVAQAPVFLVWVADLARSAAIAEAQNAPSEGLGYLESFLTAAVDVTLAAQSALVALESMGLGGVFIGGVRNDIDGVARALDLPPQSAPILGLCVGWPHPEAQTAVKPRLPQPIVLHREIYSSGQLDHVETYDRALSDFQANQGAMTTGWTASVLAKISGGAALNGRQHLSGALGRRGFALK